VKREDLVDVIDYLVVLLEFRSLCVCKKCGGGLGEQS
jgi:hypothetical protein